MTRLSLIRQLLQHSTWADDEVVRALTSTPGAPDQAWREYAHVLGAAEVWLSRLEQRDKRVSVWPDFSPAECEAFKELLRTEYANLQARLSDEALDQSITYTTSDGRSFANTIGDILVHVAMHGQYHRGKVNLLLRQAELAPAPVDLIAFIRGAPTATQASAAERGSPSASSQR
jgi:uncharacterized damage-inducible protein DinB